jgi:hypothetical protein
LEHAQRASNFAGAISLEQTEQPKVANPARCEPKALKEWRRPILRKIDALDAQQVKGRSRHDAFHFS